MKILYFAPHEPWPLTTGARLRDYHLAYQLARRASVTFLGVQTGSDPEPVPDSAFERTVLLTKDASYSPGKILRGIVGPTPITVLNYLSRRMRTQLQTVLEGRYDAVQVEGIQLTPYLDTIRSAPGRPVILSDWHNLESELMWRYAEMSTSLPRRLMARRTARLLEQTEHHLLSCCDAYTIASERERDKLIRQPGFGNLKMEVIPNGVEVSRYTDARIAQACNQSPPPAQEPYLLFVGSMDYHANIDAVLWFARAVWPEIRQRYPKLKFVIAGRNPKPEVLALAGENILVTGTVADVRPVYAGALAVIVSLRVGSGTRLKILEAMAAGVPVISTTLGAEGIEATNGLDILLADTGTEMLAAVTSLLGSTGLHEKLVGEARRLVAARYDWALLGDQLFRIHCETIQASRSVLDA